MGWGELSDSHMWTCGLLHALQDLKADLLMLNLALRMRGGAWAVGASHELFVRDKPVQAIDMMATSAQTHISKGSITIRVIPKVGLPPNHAHPVNIGFRVQS